MPPLRNLLTIALLVAVLASITSAEQNPYGNCLSTTDAIYILPDTRLSTLNPWLATDKDFARLVAAGCGSNRDAGSVCFDKPAIGSGLAQIGDIFLGLTDRGPSQDCEDLVSIDAEKYVHAKGKKGKGVPITRFAPTIMHFKVDPHSRVLTQKRSVPLRGIDAHPISGISNTPADDTPYAMDCVGDPLPYDPSGLDTEGLARIPGTEYVAIVDEYAPSVVLANYNTGIILARHVPVSVAPLLQAARYPIKADIPDVFTNRRKNRGFEAVVVDKHAKYVIAILQSPMLGDDEDSTLNNNIIRCAYFNLTVSESGVPSLTYARSFIIEASSPAAYEDENNKPKDMKYSEAQYFAETKFIALERAKGQVKLFLVDFSKATIMEATKYASNLDLESDTNGVRTAAQVGVNSADKTLIWDSANVVGGSIDFSGSSKQEGFVIDDADPTKVWMVDDNDFGLENNKNTEMRKISLGRAAAGATVCQTPAHPPAPQIDVKPTKAIRLVNPATYVISGEPGAGAAENLDVDEGRNRAFVANDDTGSIDVYDISTTPVTPIKSYTPGAPYIPTSASVCAIRGVVAAAFANGDDESAPGRIDIFSSDLQVYRKIRHPGCILPDDVKWSPDCKFLVAACEGEGANIPGGVLVADFGGPAGSLFRGVKVANFKAYDTIADILKRNGVRLIESNIPSVDLEPEYVSIRGKNAFVTIQEANAIAVVDLYEAKITELKPIGFIDRSRGGFGLDASNKDDAINIKTYPFLYGMPQPDTIQNYVAADGMPYLVFANEGDAKDDAEEARGGDIIDPDELNRNAVSGLKQLVEDEAALGRLKFSTIMGYNASTNTQEKMFHFGSRSFSIMSFDGRIVFDSGEWFARIQEKHFPAIFNANTFDDEDLSASQADLFDDRYVMMRFHID